MPYFSAVMERLKAFFVPAIRFEDAKIYHVSSVDFLLDRT